MTRLSEGNDTHFKFECTRKQLEILAESAAYYRWRHDPPLKRFSGAQIIRMLLDQWNEAYLELKAANTPKPKIRKQSRRRKS